MKIHTKKFELLAQNLLSEFVKKKLKHVLKKSCRNFCPKKRNIYQHPTSQVYSRRITVATVTNFHFEGGERHNEQSRHQNKNPIFGKFLNTMNFKSHVGTNGSSPVLPQYIQNYLLCTGNPSINR